MKKLITIVTTVIVVLLAEAAVCAFIINYKWQPFSDMDDHDVADVEVYKYFPGEDASLDDIGTLEPVEYLRKVHLRLYPGKKVKVADDLNIEIYEPRNLFRIKDKKGKVYDIGVIRSENYSLLINGKSYRVVDSDKYLIDYIEGAFERITASNFQYGD